MFDILFASATNRGAMSIAPKVHNSGFPRPTGIASPRMTMGVRILSELWLRFRSFVRVSGYLRPLSAVT